MSAIPTAVRPEDQHDLLPVKSYAVDLSSTDDDLTANFAPYARELYVGTAGTVIAQLAGDSEPQTYKNVAKGTTLSGIFVLVKKTGTTASDILARR